MSTAVAIAGVLPDVRAGRRDALRRELAEIESLEAEAAALRARADRLATVIRQKTPRAKSVDELPAMQRWRMRARPPLTRAGWVPTRPAHVPAPVIPDRVAAYMSQPELTDESWWTRLRAWAGDWAEWLKPAQGLPPELRSVGS